ncbi:MAG: GNAT family N-acetyltransferase [Magnetococcales bacterium]|nr:GNAT family N-acetyltransferase [Magnetococcales bacterium]MBF0150743.1 GNAT family N-acetyltransferase [Magnetococcales bacterium]MBF0346029.1 GNAT family N-acetyltransferase [Magnetococcales bacterium]MBF0631833.1 GNAT family N-acetyltransferase [Magnetococcales bacterium]
MAQPSGKLTMKGGLSLRFAGPGDELFLLAMFKAARPWLTMASSDSDLVHHLYEEQKRITRIGNETVYPEHLDFIIEKLGQDVGHMVIDLSSDHWRLSQLELHPLGQGKGIGSDAVASLKMAAQNANVALTVATPMMLSRVIGFYKKLGFGVRGLFPPMVELIWIPPSMQK